jgi:hypothetical protein
MFSRAAYYVDRTVHGAELPIEQLIEIRVCHQSRDSQDG